MAANSTVHLARLLSLVPYLIRHPGARLRDVAQTFGVTEAELRRDLDLIFVCGLPGYYPDDLIEVDIADDDTITIRNADTISAPLRLTRDEALPLIVALRMLADLPGLIDREAVDSALAKLESAMQDAARDAPVAVDVETVPDPTVSAAVHEALQQRRRLHLSYYVPSRDEVTEREVDPLRVEVVDGRTYLEAWCWRADALRLFRLDRIAAAKVLDVPAEPPSDIAPRDLDAGLFQPGPGAVEVTLRLAPAARWVVEYYACDRIEAEPDGGLTVTLRTPDTRWVRRLALRLGQTGRILAPGDLAAQVRDDARAALEAYRTLSLDTPTDPN